MTASLNQTSGVSLLHSVKQQQEEVDLVGTFDQACKLAGMAHKEVASLMGCKPEALYQMLRQQRPLSIVRLLKLRDDPDGRKFLRAYWPLIGEAMGLPEFADGMRVGDALIAFVNNTQKRMARVEMDVREDAERKRA